MLANVTLDARNWAEFKPRLDEFAAALPVRRYDRVAWKRQAWLRPEGLTQSSGPSRWGSPGRQRR